MFSLIELKPMDWNLCRSCLAVLQEGSLSGAARALGSTQPSIGRHIAALEAHLGQPLFIRSPSGLQPTALALRLQPAMQAMATAAQQLARTAEGDARSGQATLRITASQIVGAEVLPAILARFRALHPHVTLELSLNNRQEDLLHGEADLAVRMARPTQQALVSRKLGRVDIGLFAHRNYIQRHGMPASLQDLAGHTLIGFDRDPVVLRQEQAQGMSLNREMFQFRSDSDVAQMNALRAGLGIGGMQWGLARHDPELQAVLPQALRFDLDMWLVMHEDLRRLPAAQALFKHLSAELSAYAASCIAPL
jgi:DNA-binding transcriptional LysR family regulator